MGAFDSILSKYLTEVTSNSKDPFELDTSIANLPVGFQAPKSLHSLKSMLPDKDYMLQCIRCGKHYKLKI